MLSLPGSNVIGEEDSLMRTGVSLPSLDHPCREIVDFAATTERAGLDSVWNDDAFTNLFIMEAVPTRLGAAGPKMRRLAGEPVGRIINGISSNRSVTRRFR